jgi:hypothetical protein
MSGIPSSGIFAVIDVIIGFFLYQIADLIKDVKSKKVVKTGLANELLVIRESLFYAISHDYHLPKVCCLG